MEYRLATTDEWLRRFEGEAVAARDRLVSAERGWSWSRLALFSGAVAVWFVSSGHTWVAGGCSAALLAGFGLAVRAHRRVRRGRALADSTLLMVAESRRRCGGVVTLIRSHERPGDSKWFPASLRPVLDDGPVWALTAQERDDLDFYAGPVGVFGLLNRCSTAVGARRLRCMMERPCLSVAALELRRSAVRWLAAHGGVRLRLMGAVGLLRDSDGALEKLGRAIADARPLTFERRALLARVWSFFSAGLFAAAVGGVATGTSAWGAVLLMLFLVNGAVYAGMWRELNAVLGPWRRLSDVARRVVVVGRVSCAELGAGDGRPDALEPVRGCFEALVDRRALPSLCRWMPWAESGGLMHILSNLVVFYDVHVATLILKRVVPQRDAYLRGLAALADLEALISLGCFAAESGEACFASLSEGAHVQISGGRHPLIPPERAVANDVRLDGEQRLWVVTGSNMAGKSTLLRMTASNCVLAQVGTASLAAGMSLSPVRLITDLQARDNLAENESYFLAEVRHIRRLVSPPDAGQPVLGLMDEPLRGTNTAEQVAAALAVVEHLLEQAPHLYMLATHERRLAALAERHAAACNVHFEENLEGDRMAFDYRLRSGPATSRNALRVLEREGYPESLLQRARAYLEAGDLPAEP